MTRKWNVPLTYEPKIEPVRNGTCTQTIRPGRKYAVGDLIRFYVREGRPYRSKRKTITEYARIEATFPITIFPLGITFRDHSFDKYFYPQCDHRFDDNKALAWNTFGLTKLAESDGIIPPTGNALRGVLIKKNGPIPDEGMDAQIIRWVPK